MNEYRKKHSLADKKGLRIEGTIQDIFSCLDSDFILKIWLKKQVDNFKLPESLQKFMNKKVASRREILEYIW